MYIIKKPFLFAHDGIRVEAFAPSEEPKNLTDECAEVALTEGWAAADSDDKPAKKARKAAPENKAHDAAPEDK